MNLDSLILAPAGIAVYVAALTFLRPKPKDPAQPRPGILASIPDVKATMALGTALILAQAFATDGSFGAPSDSILLTFALTTDFGWQTVFPQIFSNSFLHLDAEHLIMNVCILGLLSVYERRVGSVRFLLVFGVGAVFSSLSIFLQTPPSLSLGASGGLFALGAAYVTDRGSMTVKEWIGSIALLALFFVALGVMGEEEGNGNIDHAAHALGLVTGVLFCRVFPRPHPAPNPAPHPHTLKEN